MIFTICRYSSERGDSNARPLRPERSALPTALLSDYGRGVSLCLVVSVESILDLLVLTQALNVYGTLHLEALDLRRLVELLTTTKLLHYASLLKFSLKFLEGSFDVLALFYGYYDHFV